MKRNDANNLLTQLSRISECLDVLGDPQLNAAYLASLDNIISRLQIVRRRLASSEAKQPLSDPDSSLKRVIEFLENAKSDESLMLLLADVIGSGSSRSKRVAIEIPANLSNEEIRELLTRDLSRHELKAVAVQRGISVGKRSEEEIKREILENLKRQEGYQRLAAPRLASE